MKAVVQRVSKASVVNCETGKTVAQIGQGIFILLGISKKDKKEDAEKLANKITHLRIMSDAGRKMNLSIFQTSKEVLVVSQFTLLSDLKKGNRPSFPQAMESRYARILYEYFVKRIRAHGLKVATGSFGAYMRITASLDGPVTIVI